MLPCTEVWLQLEDDMISVQEATDLINSQKTPIGSERIPLIAAHGRVLSKSYAADRPFPPFDRVTMDGIAIHSSALAKGTTHFKLESKQFAGEAQKTLIDLDACIETATGAMLPGNCDAIIPYEHLVANEEGFSLNPSFTVRPKQNIHSKGSDLPQGAVVLKAGSLLNAANIALAASIGLGELEVKKAVRIAIVSTGDELVPVEQTPLPHQIRRTNALAIAALLSSPNVKCADFHLEDDPLAIEHWIRKEEENFDVLIFSGGVSMGKKDFLPACFAKLNITEHFHKITQRPGKPLWFGSKLDLVVFGLPGNPVSTHFCTVRYVQQFIYTLLNIPKLSMQVELATSFSFKPTLTLFKPVILVSSDGKLQADPVALNGSGDFSQLGTADGFIELPSDQTDFEAGSLYPYFSLV
ncbi:MAG: molybdopterin molybdotransferase [Flavobacteriales bacterium]